MAYVSQEMKSELAPAIKAILKKYDVKGSLSVDNHSTLVLTIKSGKIDFIKNANDVSKTRVTSWGDPVPEAKDSLSVNTYWYQDHFTGKAKKFLGEIISAMKGPKFFDHSDAMSDYFHCSHYIDINVGKWNKPYILEK
jgi:hypothetical protein